MQAWLADGVRQERTGWRDQQISARHRVWGFDCPAVDLDFLVTEYNIGEPVALIEYKHHSARRPVLDHPTYRSLLSLANGHTVNGVHVPLPFAIAFYWPDHWAFRPVPVNDPAKQHFDGCVLSEYDFVEKLYCLRRRALNLHLKDRLNHTLPEHAL